MVHGIKGWLREGSTKALPSESAPLAARSPREQADFEAFKKEREKPTATLIKGDPARGRKIRKKGVDSWLTAFVQFDCVLIDVSIKT